jgi:hypothetical protein
MWADWDIIYHALAAEWLLFVEKPILVSGHCPPRKDEKNTPGADYICEYYWNNWGGPIERYPAKWRENGVLNRAAGFERNHYMANLPDVYKCLAFQLDGSGGTQNCVDEARKNNIPVNIYERWSVYSDESQRNKLPI